MNSTRGQCFEFNIDLAFFRLVGFRPTPRDPDGVVAGMIGDALTPPLLIRLDLAYFPRLRPAQ